MQTVPVCSSSVRVSNELGAGNPKSAAFSVVVVTVLSFILSVIISVIILLCRDYISYIFTEGEDVSRAVSRLTPLLAFTLILDGIQPVLSGMQKPTHCISAHGFVLLFC
jgi:multidrug resistance protein, MATE family